MARRLQMLLHSCLICYAYNISQAREPKPESNAHLYRRMDSSRIAVGNGDYLSLSRWGWGLLLLLK